MPAVVQVRTWIRHEITNGCVFIQQHLIEWGKRMLSIFYGNMPEAVYDPAEYFKNTVQDSWITDPMSVEMIRDVDHSEVLGAHVIESPVFGGISPRDLSGGVKTLILINHVPSRVFNASACGDNCARWLLRMGEEKDVTVNLRHLMHFGEGPFTIHVLNTDSIVHDRQELFKIASKYVR